VLYNSTQNFAGATVSFGKPHRKEPFENMALTWSSQEAAIIPKRLTGEAKDKNRTAVIRYCRAFSIIWLRESSRILTSSKEQSSRYS
jgi:hypothetical protein